MKSKDKLDFLLEKANTETKLDQDLLVLTAMSSLLAVYGVKTGNVYVLIGSMLVSPLFDPLVSIIVFYIAKEREKYVRAIKSLLTAITLAITVSFLAWVFLDQLDQLENFVYVAPSFDLLDAFVISTLSGIVGALLWIWPKTSNTSAGVAISIALIPPLVSFTAGPVALNYVYSIEYFILFSINLLGIFLGAAIIFPIYLRGKFRKKL